MRPRIEILGVPLDTAAGSQTRANIRDWLSADSGVARHGVTLNPEQVIAARGSPVFAVAITEADFITADGVGVQIAAKLLHGVSVQRTTGVDLLEWLAGEGPKLNASLFLLGASSGVAEAAAKALRQRFPATQIAGCWGGGTSAAGDDPESLRRIAESGANVVAVAYGAPGQSLWITRNQPALAKAGVVLAIGVGGSLDYLSGHSVRAPGIARRLGLEWAFRLAREPWRWRRQTALPVFALLVLRERLRSDLERIQNRGR